MTLADVELYVRNYCATELHENRAKTVRRSARLSALHLAEWFASNWWRLIWELWANDAWMRAKQAARMVRQAWHLDGPATTSMIANIFAIRESDLSDCMASPIRPVSAGFRIGEEPDRMRIAWHIRSPAGRRFSLARMVADHLVSPSEERLLPVTRTVTGRQQFQRAFAQEFLCPYDALREVIGGSPSVDDIEYAADYFAVSTWVVVCAFVNNGALPQETLADWGVSLATQNW